ncbi:sialate O-acetylesterase [Roseibacillus persicicus]|uniref:Sialate O-acetylesterase n=1 Tax=Roseibacillus persicicus TaxID=454148 RepID=A0A918TBX8_9BACT|nr:sialate O-acetylesterase [Roseibacillus persicicus]GHC42190.1 sialate O-acetylesterase [Roseibacillus persicicus]
MKQRGLRAANIMILPACLRHPALFIALALSFSTSGHSETATKPLRVYILAGQSNMVGSGALSTLDAIGDDPATAPLLERMLNAEGKPRTCEQVWISSLNGKYRTAGGEGFGKLSPGYGLRKEDPTLPGDCIGPEYTFGLTMDEHYDGPTLLIKTAWGGKSLHLDYRPPSAGPYVLPDEKREKLVANGKLEKVLADNAEYSGKYYGLMMNHVRKVLSDIPRVYPDYDEAAGYELAGFVWFQGWNDYVALADYPLSNGDEQYAPYGELLAHFIRDVRKDLEAPELPFVIGVMGTNGNHTPGLFNEGGQSQLRMERFRKAMAAPSLLPEFEGIVIAVPTAPFWDDEIAALGMKQLEIKRMRSLIDKKSPQGPNADGSMSQEEKKKFLEDFTAETFSPEELALKARATAAGGFVHYYGSAKFYAQAGEAFARALLQANEQQEESK